MIDGSVLARVLPVDPPADLGATPGWQTALTVALAGFVAVRSIPIVANLLSSHQRMNASFDRLHLVNTYGAFGSVTKVRREVIIEGTTDAEPGPDTEWLEYEVRGKPGDVRRRPPQVAPYHLRLGWLLWFVALSPGYGDGWLRPLSGSCSRPIPPRCALFDHDPFDGAAARRSCGPGCSATSSRPGRSAGRPARGGGASRPASLQAPMGFARR